MQFVTELPDSPKSEAKGVILVKGPWDETRARPNFLLMLNHTMSFPCVYKERGLPGDVLFVCPFMYTGFIIVGCLRREKPEGQTGTLSGESQFFENLEPIRDFQAGAAS